MLAQRKKTCKLAIKQQKRLLAAEHGMRGENRNENGAAQAQLSLKRRSCGAHQISALSAWRLAIPRSADVKAWPVLGGGRPEESLYTAMWLICRKFNGATERNAFIQLKAASSASASASWLERRQLSHMAAMAGLPCMPGSVSLAGEIRLSRRRQPGGCEIEA